MGVMMMLLLLVSLSYASFCSSSPTFDLSMLQRGDCPEGWLDFSMVKMGCILLDDSEARASFDEAVQACYGHDSASHVVEIHNQQQQDLLAMALKDIDGAAGKQRFWWNGATDQNDEGHWFW